MKKKLFIGTVLPTVAALGVIGSGFSLWIFSDTNHVEKSGSIGVTVENVLNIAKSTITIENESTSKLNFDQTALTTGNDNRPANPNGTGLTWTNPQAATLTSGTLESNYEVDWADNVKLTFTTTIKVPTAVANYVEFAFTKGTGTTWDCGTFSSEDTLTNSGFSTYTYTIDTDTLSTTDWTSGNLDVKFFDFDKVTASYKTSKEPESLTAYQAMRTAVKDSTISVDYAVKAEIVSSN